MSTAPQNPAKAPDAQAPTRLAPVADDPDTGGHFAAAAAGQVALRYCTDCGALLHLPRAYCYQCGGWNSGYRVVAPRARVYSWTVVEHQIHPAYPVPYTVALVELADEPAARLVSFLPGRPDLHAGQELHARFEPLTDGTTLVQWRPPAESLITAPPSGEAS
jgi:uncharacterized protein